MDANTINFIIALARALGIDPDELSDRFNERDENQAYYEQLIMYQRINDEDPSTGS